MLFQTTQAHEELRAKVRAFAEEEIKPIAFMLDQQNEFPDEAIRKLGEMGLMGIPFPPRAGAPGWRPRPRPPRRGGAGAGGRRHGRHPVRPCLPGLLAHFRLRHRGAEEEVSGSPGQGREDRRLRPDGAQRRIRRRRHRDHRRAQGGPLRPQRRQDLHHQRPQGGHLCGLCRHHRRTSAPGASPPSSWRRAGRASTSATTMTRWASAPPPRPS